MEEKIIGIFKKNHLDYVSGEQISHNLNMSRAAVWKHIEKLRQMGYEIDAVPHLGYRLVKTPDKLYPFEIIPSLKTSFIGRRILYYNELDSTNTTACELAKKTKGEGAVVLAEKQNKGRGRLSRSWVSPTGKGIYMSVVLKPDMPVCQAPLITLMAAVSLAQAIRDACNVQAYIKWPNDIIIKGGKVAGILTEMEAEPDRIKFIVIGIGINVNTALTQLPRGAVSISHVLGEPVSRQALLTVVLEKLENNYILINKSGFSGLRLAWKNMSTTIGKKVRASCMRKVIEGIAYDIDTDGALNIQTNDGQIEKVTAGDLVELR
ncbi:MAG: biotin--[acetyl-CoA-carboxylase] ligase [Candidatus Omnitrophica bacterium]|jgi:BirA family biotin operon repressor/biotin-[acetyl-CoA-carboxylase] ligase|nr:biotin--[acetyl-CoA-carboxylase] ligase [Candidatus Omnitrophota bacterium]